MASRFVRSSKYRHVFGTCAKKELQYDALKPSRSAWDSDKVTASTKFVGVIWQAVGGGSFTVLRNDQVGKAPNDLPLIAGHTAEVLDIEFNPFNDNVVVSGSEDGYAKVWKIPDAGLTSSLSADDAIQVLKGHKRKVGAVLHNPVADNVIATSSTDYLVKIWDIEKGTANCNITGHVDIIQSQCWNYDGSLMCTTSKDKKLRILDPRQGAVVSEVEAHLGVKGMRSRYMGKSGKIFTLGFSKTSDRQYAIWDPKNLGKPLAQQNIDTASGMLMPFWDEDTQVMFVAGKGDGNIRYYEMVEESPFIHFLSEYKSNVPARGMCMAPKLTYDLGKCEIARLLKLTGTSIEPISFCVPRKSDIFQDDIYPDTYAGEPAMSAAEWFGGKNSAPVLKKVEPGADFATKKAPTEMKVEKVVEEKPLTEAQLKEEVERLSKKVAYLEAELTKKDVEIAKLQG